MKIEDKDHLIILFRHHNEMMEFVRIAVDDNYQMVLGSCIKNINEDAFYYKKLKELDIDFHKKYEALLCLKKINKNNVISSEQFAVKGSICSSTIIELEPNNEGVRSKINIQDENDAIRIFLHDCDSRIRLIFFTRNDKQIDNSLVKLERIKQSLNIIEEKIKFKRYENKFFSKKE